MFRTRQSKGDKVKKLVQNYVPITKWLPQYTLNHLARDVIAGLTVGLMVIPQGLAYATIAGLPIQYGLFTSFMGCFVYFVFGTSKDVTLGPTAIMSLMVGRFAQGNPCLAVALCLFCGVIQLIMGICRLGFIVRFISVPVISGFVTAAAIIIGFGQIKSFLGVKVTTRDFIPLVAQTFTNIGDTNVPDLVLGLCCIILLFLLKQLGKVQWPDEGEDVKIAQRVARNIIWVVSTGRNALVILAASFIALAVDGQRHEDTPVFSLTGCINSTVPPFRPPSMSITQGNTTLDAGDILRELGPGLAIVPLIGFLESIAIAKAFARKNRYKVDASQELVALGIANCLSSFVSSYPVTGSFSRTAVNAQSGVATPAGGIFTGAIVLLALGVLTPFFQYVPKASLAALIMTSVLTMVEYRILKSIWTVRRIDLLPLIITFFMCFYEIEIGILCGIGTSLMILLYPVIWPPTAKVGRGNHALLKINGNLAYPGVEHIANEVQEVACTDPPPPAVVLDFGTVTHIDYTVVQGMLVLLEDLENRDIPMYLSEVKDGVRDTLVDGGIGPHVINPSPDILARAVNSLEIA